MIAWANSIWNSWQRSERNSPVTYCIYSHLFISVLSLANSYVQPNSSWIDLNKLNKIHYAFNIFQCVNSCCWKSSCLHMSTRPGLLQHLLAAPPAMPGHNSWPQPSFFRGELLNFRGYRQWCVYNKAWFCCPTGSKWRKRLKKWDNIT